METGKVLALVGGLAAAVAGVVSISTSIPLVSHLLIVAGVIESPLIEGDIVRLGGLIGLIGGVAAVYYTYKGDGTKVMAGGAAGLLAPCGLSLLAIIGGYMMLSGAKRGGEG